VPAVHLLKPTSGSASTSATVNGDAKKESPPTAAMTHTMTTTALSLSSMSSIAAVRIFPIASLLVVYVPKEFLTVYISLIAALLHLSTYLESSSQSRNNGPSSKGFLKGSVSVEEVQIQNLAKHCTFGLLYLTLSFHHWMQLSNIPFAFFHILYVLFIVWNCDTGALLAGRLGKMMYKSTTASTSTNDVDVVAKLFNQFHIGRQIVQFVKRVSPSKSLTGFVGGIGLGMWTACVMPEYMLRFHAHILNQMSSSTNGIVGGGDQGSEQEWKVLFDYLHADVKQSTSLDLFDFQHIAQTSPFTSTFISTRLMIGFLLCICAIAGDLVESAVKRQAGKKDSGKVLPGHGGVLDRFDSTFLAVGLYLCFVQ
jgi:CDP-diglyceride synthetase